MQYSDLTITCKQCGKEFIFSEEEQDFYKTMGFSAPQRCKPCRLRQRQSARACAECGNSFVEDAPVYCAACLINQKLELQQKIIDLQNKLGPARVESAAQTDSRLSAPAIENQKLLDEAAGRAELAEAAESKASQLLEQKAREVAELRVRLNLTISELEKAANYRDSLERMVPALENLKERMNILANNQNAIAELLLKLSKKTRTDSKNSLLETLRSFFRAPGSATPGN
jgi:hypothetical protein